MLDAGFEVGYFAAGVSLVASTDGEGVRSMVREVEEGVDGGPLLGQATGVGDDDVDVGVFVACTFGQPALKSRNSYFPGVQNSSMLDARKTRILRL